MKVHILGNGPSHVLYTPNDGYVMGCNFQTHPVDVSVIVDCKPYHIYLRDRNMIPTRRLITSKYAIEGVLKPRDILHEFEIVEEVPFLGKYMSAGHIAVDWALRNHYTELHLWGFDSIWADTQETKTDAVIDRTRAQFDLFIHWREKWQQYKENNIIVHNTIEGTQLKELL